MQQTRLTHKQKQGFSLVELLVVMAIIAILMGIVLGVTGAIQRHAAESRARAQLSGLITEIELFHSEVGRFPASYKSGSSSIAENRDTMVMKVPVSDPDYPGFMDWYEKKYPDTRFEVIETAEYDDGTTTSTWFIDPWGQAIVYDSVLDFTYRIGSTGPDGDYGGNGSSTFGEGDDITNRNGKL